MLIREAIKLAFLWVSWVSGASAGSIILLKWPEKDNFLLKLDSLFLFWEMKAYSMLEIAKKLKISYNGVYYSLQRTAQTGSNQNRKRRRRPRCTTKQEDKYIRVSSLRNRHLTGLQLTASLNGPHKGGSAKAVIAANRELFNRSKVWRTKLLFLTSSISWLFYLNFATHLMNESLRVTPNFWTVVYSSTH